MKRHLGSTLAMLVTAALVVGACAQTGGPGASPAGGKIGGSVKVIGVWSGNELDAFNKVIAPFTEQTGVKVEFESSRDQDAILTTRVAAGDPPDVASAPSPSLLSKFAADGKVIALNDILDMNKLKAEYDQSWIDLGSINGKLYQVFSWAALKGLIWYNPKTWQAKGYTVPKTWDELIALQTKMKGNGDTPWCMAVESGAASGWAGSDFHKEIALSLIGPDNYDKWWQGKLTWTSAEIKSSWTTFGQILGPSVGNVYGGADYIINTNFGDVGNPMFANPPKCMMLNQASFITSFFDKANPNLKAGEDYSFFPLPDASTKYAGAHVVAGDSWSIFRDTPQSRALLKYLVTAEAQTIWVKIGGKISPNKKTSIDSYPDPLSKKTAETLVATKIAKYDAGDLMPADMKNAYWSGILDFIRDQNSLDSILTKLDGIQKTAYK